MTLARCGHKSTACAVRSAPLIAPSTLCSLVLVSPPRIFLFQCRFRLEMGSSFFDACKHLQIRLPKSQGVVGKVATSGATQAHTHSHARTHTKGRKFSSKETHTIVHTRLPPQVRRSVSNRHSTNYQLPDRLCIRRKILNIDAASLVLRCASADQMCCRRLCENQ